MHEIFGRRFLRVTVAKRRAIGAIGLALAFGAASARSEEPAVGSAVQGIAVESAPAVFETTAQIMARHDRVVAEAPQKALGVNADGPGSGASPCGTPPFTRGAVGPTQFISLVNCNIVSYDKGTGLQDGVLDTIPNNFFNSVRSSATSDPHVRYDRTSQRWFFSIIDVTFPNNRLLLAVSDTSTITPSTTWGFFFVQTAVGTHTNCLADYPAPGIDANAIYVGVNQFCGATLEAARYGGSDLIVIQKTSVVGAGPIHATAFPNLGSFTPQGVDNADPAATEGYVIATSNASFSQLDLFRVSSPASVSPALSRVLHINTANQGSPIAQPHLGNTGGANAIIDGSDNRLFAATFRDGSLWTAMTVGATVSGGNCVGTADAVTATRNAVFWWEFTGIPTGSTPSVNQAGIVCDAAAANPNFYSHATIAPNGQGQVAIGFTIAGSVNFLSAGTAGRLAGDTPGSLQAINVYAPGVAAFSPASDLGSANGFRRWGDFSFTSLDPCDDQSIWMIQAYAPVANQYGTRFVQLKAPPPATPASASPPTVASGQAAVSVVVTGTSSAGSGFFDTPSSLASEPCRTRISSSIPGVAVNSVTWNGPTQVTLSLDTTAATSGTKTVTITNPDGQFASGAVLAIAAGADLTITKTHVGNFSLGQAGAKYTITVTNVGTVSTSGTVTVSDTLPAGLTATSISSTSLGWVCTQPSGPCTNINKLAPGASYLPITLTVNVAANAPASVTNSATVSGGGDVSTANNTANDLTTIAAGSDLTITKTHVGNFFLGQTGAKYTITVTNVGTVSTSGTVTVADTLPAGLTATSISSTSLGWVCAQPSGPCTNINKLAPGASYLPITLTVNVANNATALVTNSATVSGGGDMNPANDSANDSTIILTPPDLTITKTHVVNFFQGQIGAQYTITVANVGTGSTVGAVTVSDAVPVGLIATSIAGTGWACTQPSGPCTNINKLAPGASYLPIALTVNVAAGAPVSVTNSATVSGGGDVSTANNTANDLTTINAGSDLTITKTHVGNFFLGQIGAKYTITVTNVGTGSTSGTVTVMDSFPAGLTATSISSTSLGWVCAQPSGPCTNINKLAPGASYLPLTLTVNVAAGAPSSITNSATVSGGGDMNPANNTANDLTTITTINQLPVDLSITKTHTGDFFTGQTGAMYTITVNNAGGSPTVGAVTVTDTLPPAGLTAASITGTGWTCTQPSGPCTNINKLAPGASYLPITLTVNVAADAPFSVTNSATVSGGGDMNSANNTANDLTTIHPPFDLTITKTHTGDFFEGQVGAKYTITVTNVGTASTSGTVTVTDFLPADLIATSISSTSLGWVCTQPSGPCTNINKLAPGLSYLPITLTVNVEADAPPSVTSTATVSGGGDMNPANNIANDLTTITTISQFNVGLALMMRHTGDFFTGQTGATYMIGVSSPGLGATTRGTVTVTDTLPAGLTATAISGDGWFCTQPSGPCSRSDQLLSSQFYPFLFLTVNVSTGAPHIVTNSATVSGGGDFFPGDNTANDVTTIVAGIDLFIVMSHLNDFRLGGQGAYTITVSNGGGRPTDGTLVTVTDTLPPPPQPGLAATAITGMGWTCTQPSGPCTRSDALGSLASYPPITLTVNVAPDAPFSITNSATVSGGGDIGPANNTANDPTTIVP